LLPGLVYNPNIPYVIDITGAANNRIPSKAKKGVIFEYKREKEQEEGVILYQGHLYAVLEDDVHINITKPRTKPTSYDLTSIDFILNPDAFEHPGGLSNAIIELEFSKIPSHFGINDIQLMFDKYVLEYGENKVNAAVELELSKTIKYSGVDDERLSEIGWLSNKLDRVGTIETLCSHTIEAFGYNLNGWNCLFDIRHLVNERGLTDDEQSHIYQINNPEDPSLRYKKIFPVSQRDPNTFYPYCEIGIARDMHSPDRHMIGAHGAISHTIEHIMLNGKDYNFSIEIYDH
jgi:hypothetical protein